MICHLCCKGEAQIKYMTRSYGKGSNLLVIEDVPVMVCLACGESYLPAATLHEIERTKRRCRPDPESRPPALWTNQARPEGSG